ncbi:unnamed protein product [Haemonchus placei]|uniref:Secreted protein n=1 Tax=Haemonchus placei TaxID=6290 RepID=A0A0N4X614_HAEPC|nr:unnamed protein product [Haemonchus placei]
MVLLLTLVFFSQCSPLFCKLLMTSFLLFPLLGAYMLVPFNVSFSATRPRRDLKALERIMREMIESGGIVNPAFRPGR